MCLNWTNYLLHLLNSSHKFSYGGEYILFIEKKLSTQVEPISEKV